MKKAMVLVALFVTVVSFASNRAQAPAPNVKSYTFKCDGTSVAQYTGQDGKVQNPTSSNTNSVGTETDTTNGNAIVVQNSSQDQYFDTSSGKWLVGVKVTSSRTTTKAQLANNMVRETSSTVSNFTNSNGSTSSTTKNTVSDYSVGSDGTKTLVDLWMDGEPVNLDGIASFEMDQPDGTRIFVWEQNKAQTIPQADGGNYQILSEKTVCTYSLR